MIIFAMKVFKYQKNPKQIPASPYWLIFIFLFVILITFGVGTKVYAWECTPPTCRVSFYEDLDCPEACKDYCDQWNTPGTYGWSECYWSCADDKLTCCIDHDDCWAPGCQECCWEGERTAFPVCRNDPPGTCCYPSEGSCCESGKCCREDCNTTCRNAGHIGGGCSLCAIVGLFPQNTNLASLSSVLNKNQTNRIFSSSSFLASIGLAKEQNQTDTETEVVNCFDHYVFGSLEFKQLMVKDQPANAGSNVVFETEIFNNNDYPIAKGAIFAKIYKTKNNIEKLTTDVLLDAFVASQDINLWPKETKIITFSWQVPENALLGEYQVKLFFSASDKFNLNGLSFAPAIFGKAAYFYVNNGKEKGFWFDLNNIKFNDKKLYLASWIPTIQENEKVSISLPLISALGAGEANVSLNLYYFDLLSEQNRLTQHDIKKEVGLGLKNQTLNFELQNLPVGAYVAKISLEGENQKSLIDVRFAVSGKRGRFIFSGFQDFPLKKGKENSLFACFSNAADFINSFNGKVNVQIKDKKTGQVLASMDYEGKITPQVMGIEKKFVPNNNSEKIELISQLFDEDGNLMDEVKTDYDISSFSKLPAKKLNYLKITLISLAIIILGVLLYFLFRKMRSKKSKILTLLGIFVALTLSFFVSVPPPAFSGEAFQMGVRFDCDISDQPCCRPYGFCEAGATPVISSLTSGISYSTSNDKVMKFGSIYISPGTEAVVNMSTEDEVTGDFSMPSPGDGDGGSSGGEWFEPGGYLDTPPINFVDNIDDAYFNPGRTCKTCEATDSCDFRTCPNLDPYLHDTWRGETLSNYCVAQANRPYTFSDMGISFSVYLSYISMTGTGYCVDETKPCGLCAGFTNISEREITLSTTGPLQCTLFDKNNTTRTCDAPCSLKGKDLAMKCNATDEGNASIIVKSDLKGFMYAEAAFTQNLKYFPPGAFLPPGENACSGSQQCACFDSMDCIGFFSPFKSSQTFQITDEYRLNIVSSSLGLEQYQVGSQPAIYSTGPAYVEKEDLPSQLIYTLKYQNMFPATEGTPVIVEVNCGDNGSYSGGSCDSVDTCLVRCDYPASAAVGTYDVYAKIANSAKFAEWKGTLIIGTQAQNNPPSLDSLQVLPERYCIDVPGCGEVSFSWTYHDPDGNPESRFDFQIDNNSDFSSAEVNRTFTGLSYPDGYTNTQIISVKYDQTFLGCDYLTYDKTYYVRARVWDDGGLNSGWVQYYDAANPDGDDNPNTFTKDPGPYPHPDFDCPPADTEPGESALFIDKSICYEKIIGGDGIIWSPYDCETESSVAYLWNFGDDQTSLTRGNVTHIYNAAAIYNVSLRVTDDNGSCIVIKQCPISTIPPAVSPLPEWKEVSPF